MASDNTTLNSVGPIAVQLKQKLSSLEKTQINSVKNIGASLSPNAGVINGDVSSVVSGVTNKEKSMMEIGVNVEFTDTFNEDYSWTSSFSFFQDFPSNANLLDVQDELIDAIFAQLLEDIFNKAFTNW